MIFAHIGGFPVEETLVPWASGLGAGLLMARAWVATRVRRGDGRVRRGTRPRA